MALLGGLLLIFVAVFAFLRFGSGDIRSAGEIEVALRAGHPVAVVFYSNYCIACLGAKPAFDGLEREFSGRATFLRVNLQSDAGRALAERYRVDTVPTFVAFDRDARVLLQLEGDPGVPVAELRQALLRSRAARSWR
jgi:thiol-disulfide isomerase/thioredoxin